MTISNISLFDVYLNTLPYSFCVCVSVCVDCVFVIASICVCVHVCMHMREREREQKWFLFCFLGKTCKDGSEWPSVIFLYLMFTWILCLIPSVCACVCVCVDCGLCVCDCKYMCVCACVHAYERESKGTLSSELAIRTELNFVLFLGKTCKVAILTEVLLLGMDVVELMRKCVALCRLQQLPDTSSP